MPEAESPSTVPATRRHRRWPRALLVPLVLGLHLLLLREAAEGQLGWGDGDRAPPRIDVAFVRELAQQAPPAAAPVPAAPAKHLPAVAQAAAPASAPKAAPTVTTKAPAATPAPGPAPEPVPLLAEAPASAPEPEPPPLPSPDRPPVSMASVPASAAPQAVLPAASSAGPLAAAAASAATVASTAASAPAPQAFDWPPSTRLSYRLTGHYRGPVEGQAQVEWLRQGSRYQVRLESSAGPLFSRQVVSEGELGETGLQPRRFSGEQKILFASARRWSLSFDPEQVQLSDGRSVPALPGTQDEASQFVQLTWLFTTQPQRLQTGRSVEFPLAITRKLERWTFDVAALDTLHLPFGAVEAFHIKPRREATGGDMTAEIWIAPTLQYLPVRILIRQRGDNWVDLQLDKPPLQAAGARPS